VLGGGYRITKYFSLVVGYSVTPVDEPSPGFRVAAAQVVSANPTISPYNRYNANDLLLNKPGAFDGFPLFVYNASGVTTTKLFPNSPTVNHHRSGILRLSIAPAPRLEPSIQRAAENAARRVLESLKYVGVLAIEFFEHQGELLANEMAPRVHNSGHWTIEGAVTSQFENHLRAVLGLPLGSTGPAGHCAMLNLIGDLPESAAVLAVPDAHLHLYGKSSRSGRKLGHVTLRAASPERLALRLSELPAFFPRPDFCLDPALAPSAFLRA